MGSLDFIRLLGDWLTVSTESDRVSEEIVKLAERSRSDRITPELLVNDEVTRHPLYAYVEDEQPEYVLRAGELVISDVDGTTAREYPTGEQRVLVSDRRFLFVVGGRVGDEIREVPLRDVAEVYLDTDSVRRYLVVEADREEVTMTFFADVTLDSNTDDVREAVEYARTAAAERRGSSIGSKDGST